MSNVTLFPKRTAPQSERIDLFDDIDPSTGKPIFGIFVRTTDGSWVDGETASAVSDYLIVREAEGGLIPVMGGTYRDKFVKTPAGWRFSRKELEHHIAGDMALKNGR